MKYLITLLKILGACVLGGIVDDTDLSSIGTAPPDLETYDISSDTRFNVVSCVRRRVDDLDYELCKRNKNAAINKVVDGEVVIWENNENHFRESSVIYDLEIPVALRIRERGTGNLNFYRRIEEGWKNVPQVEYIEVLKELRGSVPTRSTLGINLRFHNDNPCYAVEKITKKEANMYIYSPSRGHKVKFVYDNSRSIWKATEPSHKCISAVAYFKGEAPHLLHLFVADDNFQVENIFFKLVKGQWKEVTEEEYTDSVPELKDNSDRSIPSELDLEAYNYEQFDIKSRSFEDPYIKYIPKDEYRVTRVTYEGELIWESEDPDIFASSVDFFIEGGPLMTRINFNFQYPFYFKVFLKRSRGWEEGDETDVKDRIYVLQTRRNQVLDLVNVDNEVVSSIPSVSHGVEYLLISSRKSCDVMAIREGTQEVWTYPGLDKYFANAWLYFFPKRPKLLHFRIRDTYVGHEDFYHLWKHGWWHPISRQDYWLIMKDMALLTKHGLVHMEVPLSNEMRRQLQEKEADATKKPETQEPEAMKKPLEVKTPGDTGSEEERAGERTVDRGFKEKLYSKYGSPDFDPTDDEETLRLIAKLHDEDFYDEAATLTNSIEYLSFPYDLMSSKSTMEGAQPRRRRALSFSHYDPREFRDYRDPADPYPRPKTPLPPYRSTDAISGLEDDFDQLNLSRTKKYKSTSDITKEVELRGSYGVSQMRDAPSTSPISRSTSESWSSEEITLAPPPTPEQSLASERTPSPTLMPFGSDSSDSDSSSYHTPSPPDTPERPRRRIRQEPPKEPKEPKKPNEEPKKPDSAFVPTLSALFLISIFSVIL